jgi:hypothetical protein
MTAEAHAPRSGPPARTPAEVRAALTGTDRASFERDYQAALSRAAIDYDLTPLQDVLNRWWHVAVLTIDEPAHQRMLDTAADLRAGRPVTSAPWSVVRAELGV